MKKEFKVLIGVLFYAFLYNSIFAVMNPDQAIGQAINFIKWGIGAASSLATLIAGFNFIRGWIEKSNGNREGDERIKNAIYTIIAAAVGWILLVAIIGAGVKFGTGVSGMDKGWQ